MCPDIGWIEKEDQVCLLRLNCWHLSRYGQPQPAKPLDLAVWQAWLAKGRERDKRHKALILSALKWAGVVALLLGVGLLFGLQAASPAKRSFEIPRLPVRHRRIGGIDPTKVTRTALQNAASIASLMLTTEAMICGVVEESGE